MTSTSSIILIGAFVIGSVIAIISFYDKMSENDTRLNNLENRINILEKEQNQTTSTLTYGTMKAQLFYDNKCKIESFYPISNLHAMNCLFQEWNQYLTDHKLPLLDSTFFENSYTNYERNGLPDVALYDAFPSYFRVVYSDGQNEVWYNSNGTDIYPLYLTTMKKICHHECLNGDLP